MNSQVSNILNYINNITGNIRNILGLIIYYYHLCILTFRNFYSNNKMSPLNRQPPSDNNLVTKVKSLDIDIEDIKNSNLYRELLQENNSYKFMHSFYNMELKDHYKLLHEVLDHIYDLPEKYRDPIVLKMSVHQKKTFDQRYQEYIANQNKKKIKEFLIKIFVFFYILYLFHI